jgi:hypothetical protein
MGHYIQRAVITLIILSMIILLDYTLGGIEGLGWIELGTVENFSPILNPWYLLYFLPLAPIIWALSARRLPINACVSTTACL